MMTRFGKTSKISLSILAVIMILAGMFAAAPVQAAASGFTVSQNFPFNLYVYVPCAAGGNGEVVQMSGYLHDLFSITWNANGGYTLVFVDNPQGISGYGQTTGLKYQATGETYNQANGQVGYEETYVNNFKIIGQGPNNNFMVQDIYHVTVNANGTVTAYLYSSSVVCK